MITILNGNDITWSRLYLSYNSWKTELYYTSESYLLINYSLNGFGIIWLSINRLIIERNFIDFWTKLLSIMKYNYQKVLRVYWNWCLGAIDKQNIREAEGLSYSVKNRFNTNYVNFQNILCDSVGNMMSFFIKNNLTLN